MNNTNLHFCKPISLDFTVSVSLSGNHCSKELVEYQQAEISLFRYEIKLSGTVYRHSCDPPSPFCLKSVVDHLCCSSWLTELFTHALNSPGSGPLVTASPCCLCNVFMALPSLPTGIHNHTSPASPSSVRDKEAERKSLSEWSKSLHWLCLC